MTWINTTSFSESAGKLRETYSEIYEQYPGEYHVSVPAVKNPDGSEDSIIAAHSLIPDLMKGVGQGFAALLSHDLPLTRQQHEMIATVVSGVNQCFY